MPIYDYKCRKCKNQFELLILKTTVAACPTCESKDLEQLLSTGIAVSTESGRHASLQAAKRRYASSKDVKDKKVAEVEDIREHYQEGGHGH